MKCKLSHPKTRSWPADVKSIRTRRSAFFDQRPRAAIGTLHAASRFQEERGQIVVETSQDSVDLGHLRQQSLQLAFYLSALDLKGQQARSRVRRLKGRVRKTLAKYRQQLS
jgi:hypothetical protein